MIWSRSSPSFRSLADRAAARLIVLAAALSAAVVGLMVVFLVLESREALARLGPARFLTDEGWFPRSGRFALLPMIAGTLLTSLGAILLAAPAAIASALFCRYYADPRIARAYRRLIELLAGVPSVVYGLWGLTALVPLIARLAPPGASLLAATLVLALMILPTLALFADAAFEAVPEEYVRGAAALGLDRGATVLSVVLPAARPGLFGGLVLQSGRALGETMAVLMVAGNVPSLPSSLFDPVRTLTANIALEMAYAMGEHRSALFVSGLVLAVLVIVLSLAAARLGRGMLRA